MKATPSTDQKAITATVIVKPKRRRPRGSGSVFKVRRTWWIAYKAADGKRVKESSSSERKGDAERLLESRNGSRIHRLPVIKNAEHLTFDKAAQAVIDDCAINHTASLRTVRRRIQKHLTPVFGGQRMAGITSAAVVAYIAHRQKQGIANKQGVRRGDVSNAEINRELQTLKRIFNLAIEQDRIAMKPKIKLLQESAARSGFFEREQYEGVLRHLPAEIQPVITMAYVTGWRVHDEILPLEWRQVDFVEGEIRLDPGTTKNRDGRVFPMTADLRTMFKAQHAEHERLKKAGHIFPNVFWRMVAKGRGGEKSPKPITSFNKAWKLACRAAGCPGRIPHDLRRTAVRNLVRAGIPERVAMQMTGHKTRSVFERYNIVSGGDLARRRSS
jgi:integrase